MRIAVSIILFLCLTLCAHSSPNVRTGTQPPWLMPVHPDQSRQPSPAEISNGFYYELQDDQTNLLLRSEYTHLIRHIVNASGVQEGSEVSVTFSPQYQQVVFHRIAILRDGAALDQLQPSRIKVVQEETGAGDYEYTGLKRAYITLPDIRKGDRIDIAYTVIGFNPVFGNKYATREYFTRSTAICNYFRTIITSPDRPLHFLARNHAPAPEERQAAGSLIYHWDNPTLAPDDDAPDAPSWYDATPYVCVTEYKDWREVAEWGLATFSHYRYDLPAALLDKVAEWRKAAGGNKDLLANLATRFVQNDIRYLGLEMGENSHRPHAPADVFANRYGDCKDKALLLACILRHEGIPAFATLINTMEGKVLPGMAPSPGVFDHTIVAIQRPGGQWLYVDPTLSAQRGELTDLYTPDYGYTLLLRDGEDSLRTVTPGRNCSYTISERLDARFDDTSLFNVSTTYNGGAADKVRRMFEDNSRKDIEDNYIKFYSPWLEGILPTQPIGFDDDSLANTVTVRKSYAIPRLWTYDKEKGHSLDFIVKMIRDNLPDPPAGASAAPLSLSYPLQVRYTLRLQLPEDWDFTAGPLHVRNAAYQFDFTPESNGRDMTLHYDLTTFADHIDPADLGQYEKDYRNIDARVSFTLYQENNPAVIGPSLDRTSPERTTDKHSGTLPGTHSSLPCWPAIWLSFFYALLFSRLFGWFNARAAATTPVHPSGAAPLPAANTSFQISGWILVLGLFIAAGFSIDAWQLLKSNFYSSDNWNAWSNAGGPAMQYLFLAQLAIQLTFLAGAGAVLFWFLKRRDIFPRMFVGYAGVVLTGRLLLIAMYYSLPIPAELGAYRADLPWAFVRTGVYAAIWVTYVLRSARVRDTFQVRFR